MLTLNQSGQDGSDALDLSPLHRALARTDEDASPGETLARLVRLGLDVLPMPGGGDTLRRWRALAIVAQHDLSLAKLYEGHTDAIAIWHECAGTAPAHEGIWGVWAAESPAGRLTITTGPSRNGEVALDGLKRWCSGAGIAQHALVTAWARDAIAPQLVHVELDQAAVTIESQGWCAVGMPGSPALDVRMTRARGRIVGKPGDYLRRPGFWHGGAGVAACWFGGSLAIAEAMDHALRDTGRTPDGLRLAALGKVDLQMRQTATLLRSVAHEIDALPHIDSRAACLRARLAAEQCATGTIDEVGRALGAAPFCRDRHFARIAADLPVFIRQSHAERDFATLGSAVLERSREWAL